jgi:hypothetical protein
MRSPPAPIETTPSSRYASERSGFPLRALHSERSEIAERFLIQNGKARNILPLV